MLRGIELLHPDDVLFFGEVAVAARQIATRYKLPLRSVGHLRDERCDLDTDRWGECDALGNINLMLRPKINGEWADAPLSPAEVWKTVAHELAHLRHMNHGIQHAELSAELEEALDARREDHRDRILKKLVKMQAQRESEARLGNMEAADAFARGINRMLLENELRPSDVDYARASDQDPVVEFPVDLFVYGIKPTKMRSAWQESLAHVVAKAHLCRFLIRAGSNQVWFVGTRSHATVAEYAYGTLAYAAGRMAEYEYDRYYKNLKKSGSEMRQAAGFKASWLRAFIKRIDERFEEARASAVAAAPPGEGCVALIRLEGAVVKVQDYIDGKFRGKAKAQALANRMRRNEAGLAWGKAAADRMTIGRKAVREVVVRGQIEERKN